MAASAPGEPREALVGHLPPTLRHATLIGCEGSSVNSSLGTSSCYHLPLSSQSSEPCPRQPIASQAMRTSSTDAREGVVHLWLVDPDARTLEVYRRHADGHWLLLTILKVDDQVQQPPFDTVCFSLGDLWA